MRTRQSIAVLSAALMSISMVSIPIVASAATESVVPEPQPQQQGSVRFLTGGVGQSEQKDIRGEAGAYDLWLTLTRPDGAYLADIDVAIQNASGHTVLHTRADGPFLLVKLPPGHYSVRTHAKGRRAELRTVDVSKRGMTRVFVAMPKVA